MAALDVELSPQLRVYDLSSEGEAADIGVIGKIHYRRMLTSSSDVNVELVYKAGEAENRYADASLFYWGYYAEEWDLKLGFNTVFWGVLESNHLVDVINQANLEESFHGEDRLGQPMVQYSRLVRGGMLELFGLFGFRERELREVGQRFSPLTNGMLLDAQADYESARGPNRIDSAIRWSQMVGPWDYAVSWFHGTQRDPVLRSSGSAGLKPFYPLVDRLGVETQVTLDHVMYKAEAVYADGDHSWSAIGGGFEYTQGLAFGSAYDLGYLLEYSHDSRDSAMESLFQNDLFAGLRLTLNDSSSTGLITGLSHDLDNRGVVARIQFESRLSETASLDFDSWIFMDTDSNDIIYSLKDDSYIEITLRTFL